MIYLVGMACKQFSSLRQVNKAAFLLLFIYYFFTKSWIKGLREVCWGFEQSFASWQQLPVHILQLLKKNFFRKLISYSKLCRGN